MAIGQIRYSVNNDAQGRVRSVKYRNFQNPMNSALQLSHVNRLSLCAGLSAAFDRGQ